MGNMQMQNWRITRGGGGENGYARRSTRGWETGEEENKGVTFHSVI